MFTHPAHADPPELAGRVLRLNDHLRDLAERVRDAIASAISQAVGRAVRDAVRALLGVRDGHDPREEEGLFSAAADGDDGWDEVGDDSWRGREPQAAPGRNSPWSDAARAAAQAGLWWLRHQPPRRPLLTTAAVAAAAGGVALLAGPTFAALAGVAASVASLLLTADSPRSAARLLGV